MKSKILAVGLLASIVLAGCGGNANVKNTSKEKEPQNIKALVQSYSANKTSNQSASITPQQLIVTKSNGSKTVYALPKDDFFVSIAPYVNQTHP